MVTAVFKVEKVIKLILQVWTYSVSIFVVLFATGSIGFSLKVFIKSMFPTLFQQYWFFTAYIVLLLLSPFLNKAIIKADKRTFSQLLAIIIMLWCVIPTFTTCNLYGSEMPQFIMLYLIGAYTRLHLPRKVSCVKVGLLLASASFILLEVSTVILDLIYVKFGVLQGSYGHFRSRTSILTIATALGLLILFTNIKPFYNKVINKIAACVFGVYLLHDNAIFKSILWIDILKCPQYATSSMLVLHMIGGVIAVFTCGVVIEMLRRKLLEDKYMKIVRKMIVKVSDKKDTYKQLLRR